MQITSTSAIPETAPVIPIIGSVSGIAEVILIFC